MPSAASDIVRSVSDPDAAIVLQNVCKSFGTHRVLDDVSLTVKKGSITVLLGPSGTGKSVLLRILVGLMQPDSGKVFVGDYDIAALDQRRARDRRLLFEVRRKFGMLFQDGALFDDMDVGDNVAFPMRMHTKMDDAEIKRRVADKLARVGLPGSQK